MRHARIILLVLFVLGIAAAASGAVYVPLWGLLWLPWLIGCLLLCRGLTLGLPLVLATSVGVVIFSGSTTTYEYFWIARVAMSVVAAAGAVAAVVIARPVWRRDLRASAILLVATMGLGVGAAALHLSLPMVPACPRGPVDRGWPQQAWYWLNGDLHEETRGGVQTMWGYHCLGGGGSFCHETAVDDQGRPRGQHTRWAIHQVPLDPARYESDVLYDGGYQSIGVRETMGHLTRWDSVGRWTTYHPNGYMAESGGYQGGRKAGPWRFIYNNGRLFEAGSFHQGQRTGVWRCYAPSGAILRQGRYCPDDGCGRYDCKPGRKCDAWRCFVGHPCGEWTYWDADGEATTRPANKVKPRCSEELPQELRWQLLR
jgi:hypothetical protein